MNSVDRELFYQLPLLNDTQLARVQAHLAAGLPMKIAYGWEGEAEPACFGCLVGVAMSESEARAIFESQGSHCVHGDLNTPLGRLALWVFPVWARQVGGYLSLHEPIPKPTLRRLAVLLDQEWRCRHPLAEAEAGETVIERVAVGAGA